MDPRGNILRHCDKCKNTYWKQTEKSGLTLETYFTMTRRKLKEYPSRLEAIKNCGWIFQLGEVGEVVSAYYDACLDQSLPWKKRPQRVIHKAI